MKIYFESVYVALGSKVILTVLIFPIKQGIAFHLL